MSYKTPSRTELMNELNQNENRELRLVLDAVRPFFTAHKYAEWIIKIPEGCLLRDALREWHIIAVEFMDNPDECQQIDVKFGSNQWFKSIDEIPY